MTVQKPPLAGVTASLYRSNTGFTSLIANMFVFRGELPCLVAGRCLCLMEKARVASSTAGGRLEREVGD